MSSTSSPRSFVGQVFRRGASRAIHNPFQPDEPPIRAVEVPDDAADGSFVQVRKVGRLGHGDAPQWEAQLYAPPGTALAGVIEIAVAHSLDPAFPLAADRQVDELLEAPGLDDAALADQTALPFVTIDDESTRDLDQALYVERAGDGFVVHYALADAAWYVQPTTPLFAEALRRGASYYLPGFVVPMLPRALSEGLISLNPGVDRRAFVFRIPVDGQGHPTGTTITRARIRCRHKLSFEQVQGFLDDRHAQPFADASVARSLELFRDVGELRLRHAEHRHVVHYRRTELDVDIPGRGGLRFVAAADVRGPVEKYNEQLSLLCNVEGARLLARGDRPDDHVQPIYRVHPRPDGQRIAQFEALTSAVARAQRLDPKRWCWREQGDRSLAAFLAALPTDGAEGRIARALHRQAVLLNVRSSFSEQAAEHYGVGAEVYARFSSPMREIVGVFVHKEAWERLRGSSSTAAPTPRRRPQPPGADEELCRQVVDSANRAKETQKRITKEANRLVIDQWFTDDLAEPTPRRPVRQGTVMGLTRRKAHVLLDEPPLELKLYAHHLEQQLGASLRLQEDGAAFVREDTGETVCRIGDAVGLRTQERDARRDRWVFELVGP